MESAQTPQGNKIIKEHIQGIKEQNIESQHESNTVRFGITLKCIKHGTDIYIYVQ